MLASVMVVVVNQILVLGKKVFGAWPVVIGADDGCRTRSVARGAQHPRGILCGDDIGVDKPQVSAGRDPGAHVPRSAWSPLRLHCNEPHGRVRTHDLGRTIGGPVVDDNDLHNLPTLTHGEQRRRGNARSMTSALYIGTITEMLLGGPSFSDTL